MEGRIRKKAIQAAVLAVNLLIVLSIVLLFFFYMRQYNQKLYNQNLRDVMNVNQASAQIASEISLSHERKLSNILRYLSRHKLSLPELMAYIDDGNADPAAEFQLIGTDYAGYVLRRDETGGYPAVSYTGTDYEQIRRIVDAKDRLWDRIPFLAEFTDYYTGSRCFGRYAYVTAWNPGGAEDYVLLMMYRSSEFARHINLDGGFDGMSTVLINADGGYALRNADYKSDNFFTYLYSYNNLSLEETETLKSRVLANDHGTLRYLNAKGEDSVFVYTDVPSTYWYCVSSVPVASFHNTNPDFRFTGLLALLLAAMMAMDIVYLAKLNTRLTQSAKEANAANEAKTDFLSRMSHDIRTPINVISGMTELALLEKNPEKTVEYLLNIQSSGKFLLGLVNDILDMNKVESGGMELHPRPYTHDEFVTYLNAVIRPLCEEKGVTFTMESNTAGLTLMVDPLRFNQIFFNLLSNAAKFTCRGGRVIYRGQAEALENGLVSLDIAVTDDGVGMSEAFQRTMFLPFSQEERTLEQNGVSTGLGLAIVKRLVDLMGGTIRVESAVGKGTTFYVHLEAQRAENAAKPDDDAKIAANLSGRRILLCEDHPLNAKIIVQMLGRKNVTVDTAENGKVGLERLAEAPPGLYDAVLMDVRMPIMNGLDATKAIRALPGRDDVRRLPIIALTANAYDADVQNCLDAGMNAHLAKPVDIEMLVRTLARLIARTELGPDRQNERGGAPVARGK